MKKLWENKRDEKVNNEAERQEESEEGTSLKRALVLPNFGLKQKCYIETVLSCFKIELLAQKILWAQLSYKV